MTPRIRATLKALGLESKVVKEGGVLSRKWVHPTLHKSKIQASLSENLYN
jgi:hypothetical protein